MRVLKLAIASTVLLSTLTVGSRASASGAISPASAREEDMVEVGKGIRLHYNDLGMYSMLMLLIDGSVPIEQIVEVLSRGYDKDFLRGILTRMEEERNKK